MEKLSIEAFKAMMDSALKNITERSDEFSQLDAIAGDGDHGTAIVAAMRGITNAGENSAEFKAMLTNMALGAMQESCGSTSTLLGAFFLGMSEAAVGEELDVNQVKAMFASGLANVKKQTQARVGDKTMMDALMPAVEAMNGTNGDVLNVLQAGAQAAIVGAQKTIDMKASFGRARNLGERSIGHADPGATSWACMFFSFANATVGL